MGVRGRGRADPRRGRQGRRGTRPGHSRHRRRELLDRWLAGVRAVCAAETPKDADDGVLLLLLTALEVLDGEDIVPGLPPDLPFWQVVNVSSHFMGERYGRAARNVDAARTQYHGARWDYELPCGVPELGHWS